MRVLQGGRHRLPDVTSSSDDLHPKSGARFLLTRDDGHYRVEVFLPEGRALRCTLAWDEQGHARLDPPLSHSGAHEEVLKLARVLRRSPKARLTRWRPLD